MNWTFVVVRNNLVEQIKVFSDFWKGAEYTDNFIRSIDDDFANKNEEPVSFLGFPAYNRNEYYRKNDLTVGLYKESSDY